MLAKLATAIKFLSFPTRLSRTRLWASQPWMKKRHNSVIESTMLSQDLHLLPRGDRTKVGSNGLALSGGQKQRISLARALYLQCELIILNDVLSGLDTAEIIFHNIFAPSGILKVRAATVLLCIHATRHLALADYIVALGSDGTVVEQGCFQELVTKGQYVSSLGGPTAMTLPSELKACKEAVKVETVHSISPSIEDDGKQYRDT